MKVCRVLSEIFCKVKEISPLYKQSVKLDLIVKDFGYALKKFSCPCKEAFIIILQLRRKCRLEALAYLRRAD